MIIREDRIASIHGGEAERALRNVPREARPAAPRLRLVRCKLDLRLVS